MKGDFISENTTIHASQSTTQNAPISKRRLWTGRAMSTLAALFLFVDGVMKLVKPASVVEATIQLGYPENVILGIGVVLLVCVVLYAIPKTSILGAILLTGYQVAPLRLTCAWAIHYSPIRSSRSNIALLILGGLFLREDRLRALIPLRR
jgi:DoxX-like family